MNEKAKGIIIRKLNYADNDVIFEILSNEGEIISFIAKGARRIKSKFSGVLQLGLVISISYAKGKNLNYPNEITLDASNLFTFYTRSLAHMHFYTDVITITRSVAKDLNDAELFDVVLRAFRNAESKESLVEVYNSFLSEILELISADARLRCYASGEEINESECYYSAESNKTFSLANKPLSINLPKVNLNSEFYREYLQKLLLEYVHGKLNLRFK